MRFARFQRGSADPLLVPLVLCLVAVLGLAGFGVWSYLQFQDQRDNTQAKIDTAVTAAKAEQATQLEADFAEREKSPVRTYVGPRALGSVTVKYPKTWSVYVDESDGGDSFNAYFHPQYVRGVESGTADALRIEVLSESYAAALEAYADVIEETDLKARAIKIAGVAGTRLDGPLEENLIGTMVIFPLRDKTLKVWTESTSFRGDFEKIILKNLTFSP